MLLLWVDGLLVCAVDLGEGVLESARIAGELRRWSLDVVCGEGVLAPVRTCQHRQMAVAGASGCSYPANVSASKVERCSYWSMGTMGIAICPSGTVTVCMGMGMGVAQFMVIVSKPSMARVVMCSW